MSNEHVSTTFLEFLKKELSTFLERKGEHSGQNNKFVYKSTLTFSGCLLWSKEQSLLRLSSFLIKMAGTFLFA
jgi:hypothetical protein